MITDKAKRCPALETEGILMVYYLDVGGFTPEY